MKNRIMILLLLGLVSLSGCSDDEMIEINERSEETKIDMEAENLVDDSRPLVVYVCGEVNKPGVYELEDGSRIIDAVMAADGYTENASSDYINLASPINDGDRIYIPSYEELLQNTDGMCGNSGGNLVTSTYDSEGRININVATKEELMTLPGIGESKAEKIIAYREENGKFNNPEDIMNISGIKEGMYNKIKDKICVR